MKRITVEWTETFRCKGTLEVADDADSNRIDQAAQVFADGGGANTDRTFCGAEITNVEAA